MFWRQLEQILNSLAILQESNETRHFLKTDFVEQESLQKVSIEIIYLAHVIEQPILQILNPQYLQLNFCFDFFNDSENTFWGFFEI